MFWLISREACGISAPKPWPAEPEGRLPRGSARGTALGLLLLGRVDWVSAVGDTSPFTGAD